jgi:hypothetical protein
LCVGDLCPVSSLIFSPHLHTLSGICGAALFLAAIYHDKPRTYKDVGRIVRVSPDTIKKR